MESHFQDILYAIATIIPIMIFVRQTIRQTIKSEIKNLEKAMDKRFEQMEKRFDRIEERLTRIEQNHLDHMTALHALPITTKTLTREEK